MLPSPDGLTELRAAELQKIQTLEAVPPDSVAFGDLPHVLVDRNEDRVVADSGVSNEDIWRTAGDGLF